MSAETRRTNAVEHLVRRGKDNGSFNREFWVSAGAEARFAAAWEMIAEAELFRGHDAGESRLQRSVQYIQRRGC